MKKKYQIIYESIRRDIEEKNLMQGDFLPAESKIAKEFGVSRPTVTKALDKLLKEKLIYSQSGFGTVVLRSDLTNGKKIGLLIPQYGQAEIFEPICSAIEQESSKHYWKVILPSNLLGVVDFKKTTELLCARFIHEKVDGVFFSPSNRILDNINFNLKIVNRLKKAGIAVVFLDRQILNWPNQNICDLVVIDNMRAGLAVTNHLLKQGCKKIVFSKHQNSTGQIDIRIVGAREAIHQANLPPETLCVVNVDEKEGLHNIIKHMPDGLICANDELAANLMRKLLDTGIKIPNALKVVGFDDVKYAKFLSVPLSSFRQPCAEIGRAAVNTMKNRLDYPDSAPIRLYLQGKLIVRSSTSN